MKSAQPELLVRLDDNLTRVLRHWAAVDDALPPSRPLVLLADVDRAGCERLLERLPVLREKIQRAECAEKVARGAYELQKRVVHEWVRSIARWVRGLMRGTVWPAAVSRVPVLGQSYEIWWGAAFDSLALWKKLDAAQPNIPTAWPMDLGRGRTAQQFEQIVKLFERKQVALVKAELEVKIARGALAVAQRRATALLMAYGHGVQSRFDQKSELVHTIPRLWPRRRKKLRQ